MRGSKWWEEYASIIADLRVRSLFDFFRRLVNGPTPQQMAAQLRKPSAMAASSVAKRMNAVNAELYAVVLDALALPNAARVLELGPGNGRTSVALFQRWPMAQYTGFDYSADMVAALHKTLAAPIAAGKATVLRGSSDRMPFPDASFDVVFGVNTIYFWDDAQAHLREIRRVLATNGRSVIGYRDEASMKHLPFAEHGFTMYTVEAWEAVLHKAGFSQVRSTQQQEPEREWQGQRFSVKSCCTEALR